MPKPSDAASSFVSPLVAVAAAAAVGAGATDAERLVPERDGDGENMVGRGGRAAFTSTWCGRRGALDGTGKRCLCTLSNYECQ